MRWRGRRQSTNIRDVRGSGGFGGFGRMPGGLGGSFGRGGVRRAGGGLGIGTIIVVLIIAWIVGINPLELLSGGGSVTTGPAPQGQQGVSTGQSDEMRDFVATVLADTEETWSAVFAQAGEDYPEPTLTLFSGSVRSACGQASAATGPFYCPGDQDLYIDLAFFEELHRQFGAPGDFAQAYVLAHEVGHHVQNVLGILEQSQRSQARASEAEANAVSVRTELQADCFAGIWAHHTQRKGLLEEGDIDEALRAAAAVGDDAIQQRTQGYVVPESFNHGTSEQRATWFRRGLQSGDVEACDTSAADI
ncbi:MAG TPA: neutral zinc metallopeptidase [Propylenella sp.]|nr:neutral zinc metallopeptidase [Propylenella sp.]